MEMCPEQELKAEKSARKSFTAAYLKITPVESWVYGGAHALSG
jgi:hypothetical protein